MAIPVLDDDGYLPEGIHDCSFEEILERFGRFQASDRRPRLAEKRRELWAEIVACGLVAEVLVNGSFTTAKNNPGDIDQPFEGDLFGYALRRTDVHF